MEWNKNSNKNEYHMYFCDLHAEMGDSGVLSIRDTFEMSDWNQGKSLKQGKECMKNVSEAPTTYISDIRSTVLSIINCLLQIVFFCPVPSMWGEGELLNLSHHISMQRAPDEVLAPLKVTVTSF